MNYAQKIKENYFENKDRINKHRAEHFLSPLTLEHKLKDSYIEYRSFCISVGVIPKSIIEFLNSEVI